MKKSESNINLFYTMISLENKAVYEVIIQYLLELGYTPVKKRTKGFILSFINPLHNRVIARFGVREDGESFFGLRFSSVENYSEKFNDVVRRRVLSKNNRIAKCSECNYCKGSRFVYTYIFEDGTTSAACGAFVLDIPDVSHNDIDEIKSLIKQQHEYFTTHAIYKAPEK